MSDAEVDLFVIGAGSGGVRAGRIAAMHGARVMLAEEFRVGGTCVIRGCVPKKIYVYASRFADEFEDAAGFGWSVGTSTFDWPTLVARKSQEIARLEEVYRTNVEKAGAVLVRERAVVTGPNEVLLTGSRRRVKARTILVATGSSPVLHPSIPGLDLTITSNEVFDLETFPKRLLVIGGGYIGVEFASVFARLGAAVTLVTRSGAILRGFDDDMRAAAREALIEAGVAMRRCLPTGIRRGAQGLDVMLSDGEGLQVDQVLVATGRKPNTAGLGLAEIGVELGHDGEVLVGQDARTNIPSIYAVGDVTNRVNLTPVAIREGHAFADSVFGGRPTIVSLDDVPSAVFMTPEIGAVGLTEAAARQAFAIVDIYRARFLPLRATLSGRAERMVMKIVVDGETDRVLGLHVFGEAAAEMVQMAAVAIRVRAKKADFDATMALHPTAAEELVTMRTRTERHVRDAVPA